MDSVLREQKQAFAKLKDEERAERKASAQPLTFGKVVLAVIVGNVVLALLLAVGYQLLRSI